MARAPRNLLLLPLSMVFALRFQTQTGSQRPTAAAPSPLFAPGTAAPVAFNRRQLLAFPAAALAAPMPAFADAPRWAEVDAKLPTQDAARVFRDLEDGFEVAYPSTSWMRTQPLPELLGGAPARGTRFAATDLGQGAVIAVTCQPLDNVDWPAIQAVRKSGKASKNLVDPGADAARFARRLLEDRAAELGWSSTRLLSSAVKGPDRVEFEGKAYFEMPNDVPIVRKESCVAIRRQGKILTAWASAPMDTLSQNPEVARFLPAIIQTFRAV